MASITSQKTQQITQNLPFHPNKHFFIELGNQLCNMKDSPFYRIGQQKKIIQNQSNLDYNPSRLFKPEQFAEQQRNADQTYKKFVQQQKQKQHFEKIEHDLLKKTISQEYQQQLQKMKQMRRYDHKQPYTWFGVYRGACKLCGKCGEYEGCFSQSQKFSLNGLEFAERAYNQQNINDIEIMQCYKCKCPMNSHSALPHASTLRSQIYKIISQKNIIDSHLKFNHIILCFKLPQSKLHFYPLILQLLKNLNCPPINYKCLTKLNFQLALIKTNIIENGNTQKLYIESLLNFIESIKLQKQWKWRDQDDIIKSDKKDINQVYQQLYQTVKKIGVKVQNEMKIEDRQCVFVAFCRYEIEHMRNLMRYLSGQDRVSFDNYQRYSTNSTSASSVSSRQNSRVAFATSSQQSSVDTFLTKNQIKFIYGTSQRKKSIILSQYFFKQNYEINYNVFMLPGGSLASKAVQSTNENDRKGKARRQQEWSSARFKDILDYNNFTVFLQNIRDVDRVSFQNVMSNVLGYRSTKIDYIMGQQLLNNKISTLSFKLAVKTGPLSLTIPFPTSPDYISIKNTSKSQISKLLKVVYPQYTYSQRCVLIIRPFVMNSNFQQVIVNLLRINKFKLLKRIQIKLSQGQARFLATVQNIQENMIEEYINYMTTGVCQIILVSKRSAIYEAYALAHGCFNGPTDISTKSLKNTYTKGYNNISVQIKKNRQIYQQQLPLFSYNHQNRNINFPSPSTQSFKSIRQLIDIQKVLFGYNASSQYSTNIRTGQITKIDPLVSGSSVSSESTNKNFNHAVSSVSLSNKIKDQMLKQLKKQNFNFWVFTSKSELLTEQLAGMFMPQCTLYQPITVLLKPGLIHLAPLIKKSLIEHRYHIIAQKQLQLSRQVVQQFIENCQKIRLPASAKNYIIDAYLKQKVYIFCLSKISGRKQIMSMLSGFTFLTSTTSNPLNKNQQKSKGNSKQPIDMFAQDSYISDQMLQDMLVPIWNNQQLFLRFIAQPLSNLEQSIQIICQNQYEQSDQNLSKVSLNNKFTKLQTYLILNYLVGSFYGVSIDDIQLNSKLGKLSIFISQNIQISKLQSWYYTLISNIKPNYVPLLFQYRPIGQTIVCIQTDKGFQFMEMVVKMYKQQQQKVKASMLNSQNSFSLKPISKKQKRRSLVLFLWAKKMSQLCLDLSKVQTQLNGFGQIVYKYNQYRGNQTLQEAQNEELMFLNRQMQTFETQRQVQNNIRKLLDSRHQKQRFKNKNKRLLPSFQLCSTKQSIRIIEKSETSKLSFMDKYTFIDPQNETIKEKDLYSLHLFNILPEIRSKYSFIADIYYYLIRSQFQNPELIQIINQIQQIFCDFLTDVQDLEAIQYEIYLKFIFQYVRMSQQQQFKGRLFSILKSYPNLRRNKRIERDDVAGKKRKFIEHKQYFKRANEQSEQAKQYIEKKFTNFDLNSLKEQPKQNAIYDPKDPFHFRIMNTQNKINLLRQVRQDHIRNGVNVQFEKNISEKEELLKQKIKREAQKFNFRKQEQIMHDTGLEKDLWFRRTRGESKQSESSKTNAAIQKQIEKFLAFKQGQNKNASKKT